MISSRKSAFFNKKTKKIGLGYKSLSEKIMKSDRIDWETKLADRELA
jgi:hypothetical protein